MTLQYTKARRKNIGLLIGLAGFTGSGKTYSAFELAAGICGDEPFFVIDTEGERALHYAEMFEFEHKPQRRLAGARYLDADCGVSAVARAERMGD